MPRDQLRQHGLDGDLAIEGDVVGEVYRRHAAASQLPEDLVIAGRGFLEEGQERVGSVVLGTSHVRRSARWRSANANRARGGILRVRHRAMMLPGTELCKSGALARRAQLQAMR